MFLPLQQLKKCVCGLSVVVYSVNQRKFIADSSARGIEIILARLHQLFYAESVIYGHYRASKLVCRCMERNRERYAELKVSQLIYSVHKSAGRYRNVSQAHIVLCRQKSEKLYNIIKIIQRLAYSHKYNVIYLSSAVTFTFVYLQQHLARFKISYESRFGRCAEFTSHFAADLS